jgi:hypothetical protein
MNAQIISIPIAMSSAGSFSKRHTSPMMISGKETLQQQHQKPHQLLYGLETASLIVHCPPGHLNDCANGNNRVWKDGAWACCLRNEEQGGAVQEGMVPAAEGLGRLMQGAVVNRRAVVVAVIVY